MQTHAQIRARQQPRIVVHTRQPSGGDGDHFEVAACSEGGDAGFEVWLERALAGDDGEEFGEVRVRGCGEVGVGG